MNDIHNSEMPLEGLESLNKAISVSPVPSYKIIGFTCPECTRIVRTKLPNSESLRTFTSDILADNPRFCSWCGVKFNWDNVKNSVKGTRFDLEW